MDPSRSGYVTVVQSTWEGQRTTAPDGAPDGPRRKRSNAPFFTLLFMLAIVLVMRETMPQLEQAEAARTAGANRYDTAAMTALSTFEQATVAHIVTGTDFPDALAASFAAGQNDGPLLLTGRDTVPQATMGALAQLGVAEIVLVGGTSVISPEVQETLEGEGYSTSRLSGRNRYETAAVVATSYGRDVGRLEGRRVAMVASGVDFPDALAAGPLATGAGFPLLLTPPDAVTGYVDEALQELDIEIILLIGGEGVVSVDVEQAYRDAGYEVERIAGPNRAATAVRVAAIARERLGWDMRLQVLARGDTFPDALVAAVHAGHTGAPLLLTTGGFLGSENDTWLSGLCGVRTVRAVGGEQAIPPDVLRTAVSAARACPEES